MHFAGAAKVRKSKPITDDVWSSMHLDSLLSSKAVTLRKETKRVMEECRDKLIPHVNDTTFPFWIVPKIKEIGVNGLQIKTFGGPGLTQLEAGAVMYEFAKVDGSIAMFFLVHNCLGMAVIEALGDEKQKELYLKPTMSFDKFISFGLTEPGNGSDASALKTEAKPVEGGGYTLNGRKRWIGNATFADFIIIWARNAAEGNKVQGFMVEKGAKGLRTEKMEGKYATRITQNTDIYLEDVFVPAENRLAYAHDFQSGTNEILKTSRLGVAWWIAGLAAGAYEAALKYALKREQFGRPIAQFQLVQERLSRMLGHCEMMNAMLVDLSGRLQAGEATMGQLSRAKAHCSLRAREVVALARETCGGNGILIENHVMKAFMDIETMYTGEGTYDINSLVSGRELTGGLSAFK